MRKWPLFLVTTVAASAFWMACSWAQISPQPNVPLSPPRDFVPGFPFPRPIFPPRPRPISDGALQLVNQNAKIEVRGLQATTHLRQTLQNPTDRALEGTYLWALPRGAAVSGFAMTMGGKRLESEVLEGDKAREIYTGIVQKMRDPAILEFLDRDLVRARIFPVPAHGNVEIEINYAQTVTGQLSLPLRAPEPGQNAVSSSVEVTFLDRDVRAIYSPSHAVETRRDGEKTVVSAEFGASDRDFSLLWTRGNGKVSLDLLTFQNAGEDGYFLLLAAPDPGLAAKEIEAKDVVFVFDTSGSMEGAKIEQARRALKTLLGSLNAGDRFGIVTFSSGVNLFRDGLVSASKANLDAARDFADGIKAIGGTNISDALQSALKMTEKGARTPQIVFLTDGQPTVGQTDVDQILADARAQNTAQTRLFTFGVGNDVNARLLDALAEDNRGASDYVLPKEDIEVKVGALGQKIAFPVLSDARIDFGSLGAYDVFPPHLPDLFRGSQATVFGRFRGQADKIALTGQSGGQTLRFSGAVAAGATSDTPKLWATRKIGFLIDDARRANRPLAPEVRDEIIELSRKYGIVTPLTAALITEDEAPGLPRPLRSWQSAPFLGDMPRTGKVFSSRAGAAAPMAPGGMVADSGAAGVAASQSNKMLREGRAEEVEGIKTIEGKTFTLRNGIWTDNSLDSKTMAGEKRVIQFASREYFELLHDPKLAKWLSVGPRVVVGWNGGVLEIGS